MPITTKFYVVETFVISLNTFNVCSETKVPETYLTFLWLVFNLCWPVFPCFNKLLPLLSQYSPFGRHHLVLLLQVTFPGLWACFRFLLCRVLSQQVFWQAQGWVELTWEWPLGVSIPFLDSTATSASRFLFVCFLLLLALSSQNSELFAPQRSCRPALDFSSPLLVMEPKNCHGRELQKPKVRFCWFLSCVF